MILDRFKVDGQVAVITGAGRGIGAGSAVALAEAGADVVISARHSSQLAEVAEKVEAAGRRALVVKADLVRPRADRGAGAGGVRRVRPPRHRGQQRRRHHAAAVPGHRRGLPHRRLPFNVATAHALTRAAVPLMLTGENPGGSIVNISSVIGRVSGRGYVAYGTAKAALTHWTRLVSKDLAPLIRVNAIGTGSIMTSALDYVASDEAVMTELAEKTTMQRVGAGRGHRRRGRLPGQPGRVVPDRQGGRGRRRPGHPQPRLPAPRPGSVDERPAPRRRLVDRHHRPARDRRHRRPPRPRAGRPLGLQPGQGRPGRGPAGRSRPRPRRAGDQRQGSPVRPGAGRRRALRDDRRPDLRRSRGPDRDRRAAASTWSPRARSC